VLVHTHYYNWKRHMIVAVRYLLLLLQMLLYPCLTLQCKHTAEYRQTLYHSDSKSPR
jgi:hypothetical protein